MEREPGRERTRRRKRIREREQLQEGERRRQGLNSYGHDLRRPKKTDQVIGLSTQEMDERRDFTERNLTFKYSRLE